ncbi:MAG: hypothetical protein ACK57A_07560, partial [Gemmatimonas sp.]
AATTPFHVDGRVLPNVERRDTTSALSESQSAGDVTSDTLSGDEEATPASLRSQDAEESLASDLANDINISLSPLLIHLHPAFDVEVRKVATLNGSVSPS